MLQSGIMTFLSLLHKICYARRLIYIDLNILTTNIYIYIYMVCIYIYICGVKVCRSAQSGISEVILSDQFHLHGLHIPDPPCKPFVFPILLHRSVADIDTPIRSPLILPCSFQNNSTFKTWFLNIYSLKYLIIYYKVCVLKGEQTFFQSIYISIIYVFLGFADCMKKF